MPSFDLAHARGLARGSARRAWSWARGPGYHAAMAICLRAAHQVRRNLTSRRILSFPHMLVVLWVVALLWGEKWAFGSKVANCAWGNWEKWPKGAKPHHLIFVADPQIIDPHSYPGRPWPLSDLTVAITDTYLSRSYNALLGELHPDSLFFLGDLFDGGREWKTARGDFVDPKWGSERDEDEASWLSTWRRKYGEDFWLREYKRFGDIFFNPWHEETSGPGAWQRGRKLVASLPGNHDLGFGAQVQVPVRDRFSAFFGDVNRVDVVGNHSIVSVDTVSMSADTSELIGEHDLRPIYGPVNEFLDGVKSTKRRAVQEELNVWHGTERATRYDHKVEELAGADLTQFAQPDLAPGTADLPTILLTHVPLYREPGKPCGPQREHWPPAKPPKGQTTPVYPDERNGLQIMAGYQYQNVLNEDDSVKLIKSIGNVVHVFSGDDHDYCEVVHSESKENVKEITVKSLSIAMGVPTPGFVMASLYNPIDEHGQTIPGSPATTLQTHLCLLPNQIHTYLTYVSFIFATLILLAIRAFLVPALNLTPFALEPDSTTSSSGSLPMFKDKSEPRDDSPSATHGSFSSSSSSVGQSVASRLSGTHANRSRSGSMNNGGAATWQAKRGAPGGRFRKNRWDDWRGGGGGGIATGPRISLDETFYYNDDRPWRTGRGRVMVRMAWREMWTTTWRVAWMAVLFFVHLMRNP